MYGSTKRSRKPAVAAIKNDKSSIVHDVKPNDTLQGLAVKYRVPVLEIKRENKIWREEDVSAHKSIIIPKDVETHIREEKETEEQHQLCLEGFVRTTSCGTEEALQYLEASCWNVSKAIQSFERDMEKEENRKRFVENHPNWIPPAEDFDQTDAISVAARVRARGGMGCDNRDGTKSAAATSKKEPENFAEAIWNTFVDLKDSFTLDRIILG